MKDQPASPSARQLHDLLLVGIAIIATAAGLWLLLGPRPTDRLLRDALRIAAAAQSDLEAATQLDRWQRASGPLTLQLRLRLVRHLCQRDAFEHIAVRRALAHFSAADYRDRAADWQRWRADQSRRAAGESPRVPARERVTLADYWAVPVGLTSPENNLIPHARMLLIPSLGSTTPATDGFDGLVAVEPVARDAILRYAAPTAHEPLAIAAHKNDIFLVAPAGVITRLAPDYAERWTATVPECVSWPLLLPAAPATAASPAQLILVTAADEVLALSATTRETLWRAALPPGATAPNKHPFAQAHTLPPRRANTAALALPSGAPAILVTTISGHTHLLDAATGDSLFQRDLNASILAAPSARDPHPRESLQALIPDAAARIWGLYATRDKFGLQLVTALPELPHNALTAAILRETSEPRTTQFLIVTRGTRNHAPATVALHNRDHRIWRIAPGGMITTPPAIADLNADRRPEIIVASTVRATAAPVGLLSIISPTGHIVWQRRLPASIAAGPIVADLDRDGDLDLALTDRAGTLHVWSARTFGPVEWGLPAGDPTNTNNVTTAYQWSQRPPPPSPAN